MLNILNKVAKLQKRMQDLKLQLDTLEASGESGGGMVKVVATGGQRVKSIVIEQALLDTGDMEMIQDLVVASVNQALEAAVEVARNQMSEELGSLMPPGMEDLEGFVR